MLPDAVRDYLTTHRRQYLAKLFEWLAIPGVSGPGGSKTRCREAADWLAEYMRQLGLDADVDSAGGEPNVLARCDEADDAPTLLIYGHYDVQPPEPLELWLSEPFSPQVRDGFIYARGASDDKGQVFAHLMALDAWRRAGGGLPVNVKLLVEGAEEIGSPDIEAFIDTCGEALSADACIVSDSAFFAEGTPSITTALRGLVDAEITVTGPSGDLHSGMYGGAVANPADALAAIIAAMHDTAGRVTLEGFYDGAGEPTDEQKRAWSELPFDEGSCARSLGVESLAGGEQGYSALERMWARPTLDCNGIVGGHTGEGPKTIIPARASAKISMRLVGRQDPQKAAEALRRFVAEHAPPGVKASVKVSAKARPVVLATDTPAMQAAQAALKEIFGREAVFIHCGASVPITEVIQRRLGLEAVLMGFGLPDDNTHAPNERFALSQLWAGAEASAAFLANLAAVEKPA